MTGEVIRGPWGKFAKLFKINEENWLALSEEWFTQFKNWNCLHQIRKHRELTPVSDETVASECQSLQKLTNLYHLRRTWNVDETALFLPRGTQRHNYTTGGFSTEKHVIFSSQALMTYRPPQTPQTLFVTIQSMYRFHQRGCHLSVDTRFI